MSNAEPFNKKTDNGPDTEQEQEYFEDVAEADLLDESILSETLTPETQKTSKDGDTVELKNISNTTIEENVFDINLDVIKNLTPKPQGKYKFKRSIGYGGMKTVLEVTDKDSTRNIAMAVMPDASSRPANDLCRFVQEARILACLEHPNVVPIHDIGIDSSGSPYFTMKLLKGETLASILKKIKEGEPDYVKKYDLSRLLQVFLRVSHGVAFAHSKQIIHLDLKPENVQTGDFGEVLVLDWGLAKVLGQPDSMRPEESRKFIPPRRRDFSRDIQVTMDGVTKGTPGYMAPEQAAGRNHDKDKRTDIYSLGAILYAILTLENPIPGDDVHKMLEDTLKGEIIPPKKRAPDRLIPSALEAVVQKAMTLNPDERYQSVMELRDEIYAFIGGFCTTAEKASRAKKALNLVKRHKLTSTFLTIIFVLLISLGSYAIYDYSQQTAEWIKVYEQDFTSKQANLENLTFMDKLLKDKAEKWVFDAGGLKMEKYNWLWFDTLKIPGDVKVVINAVCKDNQYDLEICVNSQIEKVENWWNLPPGYIFQIGGYSGTKDLIMKNEGSSEADIINIVETKAKSNKIQEIVVQRENDALTITVDKKESLKVMDLFPPTGYNMNRIGIRSLSAAMNIVSLSVYRLALPEKASPLIAGDSLVEKMHFKEAISTYITIAENYGVTQVAEQSLAKAYLTAATKLTADRDKVLNEIRGQIRTKFPKFRYLEMTLEVDAIVHWREKNYREALNMVARIFKMNPNTNVVLRLLECQHMPLSPEISEELLTWISKTKNIKRLNLSNLGLESLDPIKELPLIFLDCSNNQLTTLDALKDMELETFSCANNQISSLKPLREMPLRDLNCSTNQIRNLEPLRKMPIKHLDCSYNKIEDLEALRDMTIERLNCRNNNIKKLDVLRWMPLKDLNFASNFVEELDALKDIRLEKLVCANNKFTSLGPLRTMRLEQLDCSYNKISDITSLEGMKLEYLDCSFTDIKDLQPIKNMPLKTLMIFECLAIEDISVLSKIDTLEKIGLPSNVKDIDNLKSLPLLKQIQYYNSDKVIEVNHTGVKNEKNIP